MLDIKKVTVIGASGTIGGCVTGIFASFGNAKVYAVGRDKVKVKSSIPRIVKSVRADDIAKNIVPADYESLEACIKDSDLVFESLSEDINMKKEIAAKISKYLQPHAISCTGTSGLSITEIAGEYLPEQRERFFGVHFFNPPYSMPLCELIATKYTNHKIEKELEEYLEKILYRTIVKVKDSPAFLGNRIGFYFINSAIQYAEKYKDFGGIDYIDAIIGPFTGRKMAPLMTADFVGLDVCDAILDNLSINTKDYAHNAFNKAKFFDKLVENKQLGKKTGAGFYKTVVEDGIKHHLVYDIKENKYREKVAYSFDFVKKMRELISIGEYEKAYRTLVEDDSQEADICVSLLLKYIIYSFFISNEIGNGIEAADDAMATGFNWCPPQALFQLFSNVSNMPELMKKHCKSDCEYVNVDSLISQIKPSKYDYRPFIRA